MSLSHSSSSSTSSSSSSVNLILPVSVLHDEDYGAEMEKDKLVKADEQLFKGAGITRKGTCASLCYMLCAVLLVMFNKAAVSTYNFPSTNVITLLQMICSCSLLYALRWWKIISFNGSGSLSVVDNIVFVSLETLIHTLPLSVAYLFYMLVTMESVRGVNIPMYTTLRRTTVVFTMIMEYFIGGQRYPQTIIGSVGLIVFGAFIAGVRDFSFDLHGYAVVFLANMTTAIYLATICRIGKSSGLNSFGLMWCNGVVCGPILFFWTIISGELRMALNFVYIFSTGFLAVLVVSCVLAFFLNYFIFLNTTLNSALTQTICGNLKDLFTIGIGWVLFGGLPFDILNVMGQLLGFVGSALYAYYRVMGK